MNTHCKGPADVTSPSAPPCHPAGATNHCVTCSDEVIEMEVVRLEEGGLALARASTGVAEISIALVAAQAGDTVLVHAGEAIAVA
ncbi:HypC/HybG/HupF family hydrogenase formation chaperone [Parafrankia sp. FMc2]